MTAPFQRRLNFSDVILYAVTPEEKDGGRLLPVVDKLLAGGVDAVQLRSRSLTDRAFVELGKEIKERCGRRGALFLVNNRVDLALATGADGVHLGHEDLPISFARELLGHRKIIGASTHSMPQALEAQKLGADYVSCGPIWTTPTKPEYPAVGLPLIGLYSAALRIPFVAIGGIDETNIDEVVSAGAKAAAVVRALFHAENPEMTARAFREKISINRIKSIA